MNNFLTSLNAVLAVFTMIAIGYLARHALKLQKETTKLFNRLVYHFMMPLLLFNNIYTADFAGILRARYVVFVVAGLIIVCITATWIVNHIEKDNANRGVMVQAAFRSNYLILGLPLMRQLYPGNDLMLVSAMVAVIVPTINILSTLVFERYRGGKAGLKKMLLALVQNPLVLGAASAFAVRMIGFRLPAFLESSFSDIASSTSAIALIILGTQFEFESIKHQKKQIAYLIVMRLLVVPCIMLFLAYWLGYREMEFAVLIPVFASPVAVGSYSIAVEMGGNGELAANAVALTTALSIFSLFVWIYLFKTLGAF